MVAGRKGRNDDKRQRDGEQAERKRFIHPIG
jgi:hypothetical protein